MSGRTYGQATVDSNYVGLLGEMAVHQWLERHDEAVVPHYLGPGDSGDIGLVDSGMVIEVKTSRFAWWRDHGAVLSASQFQQILGYGGLVWCVVGPELPTKAIQVLGWMSLPDLAENVQPTILRARVAFKIGALDDIESLLPWRDANRARFTWSRAAAHYECASGHDGFLGVCLQCWWMSLGGASTLHVYKRTFHLDENCPTLPERHGVAMAAEALMALVPCVGCGEPWLMERDC